MTENEIVDMLGLLHKRISRSKFHVTQGERWALVDVTVLIKRKNAEIEKLKKENEILSRNADNAFQEGLNECRELFEHEIKADAYKEFAEGLKNIGCHEGAYGLVSVFEIENLLKEMVGEEK